MAIRFKCPHCTKPLAVADNLAGKRAKCPACKKPIVIPAPQARPADIEAFAAAALADEPAVKETKPTEFIELDCAYCGESVKFAADLAGKNAPCPECKRIVKVPLPKVDKKKDWRDINKQGPAGAIINLPEQLEGAWGTELKGRVGQESLEEAGAIEVEVEAVGVRGWIRRGAWAASVIAVLAVIIVLANRNVAIRKQNNVIQEARDLAKELDQDPKKRLHPVLAAAIDRADGVLLLNQGKAEEARKKFFEARGKLADPSKDRIVDQDLYLIELARTQIDLGKDTQDQVRAEDQVRAGARFDWDRIVRNEIKQSLDRITSPEAKVIAVRDLSSELIGRKQVQIAIGLATSPPTKAEEKKPPSPMLPQLTALVIAHSDLKRFENLPQAPDVNKPPIDPVARQAYAEGYARAGKLAEAKNVAFAKGKVLEQLEAAVGVANVLVSDKSNPEGTTQAASILAEVVNSGVLKKGFAITPWLRFQLCRACVRVPSYQAEGRDQAKNLPANFQRQVQLEWVRAQLERGAPIDVEKDLPEADSPARALAWLALGQRLGSDSPMPQESDETKVDQAFVKIGRALSAPTK